jgi:hypothetical protein
MITYYAAQLGITLSVVDSYESHEVNKRVIQHQDLINAVQHGFSFVKTYFSCFFSSPLGFENGEKSRKQENTNEFDLHTIEQPFDVKQQQKKE